MFREDYEGGAKKEIYRKTMKAQIHLGRSVSCEVYTDTGELAGEFTFICSKCEFEYFKFSEDIKKLYCGNCKANVGYKLEGEWKRPQGTPGRKCLGFYMDGGFEYVWTCSCGHELHNLIKDLTHTICEKCQSKTSRRQNVKAAITAGKAMWKI